jgi:Amidases related to nicotinamidase
MDQINAKKTALIVIDLQKGILCHPHEPHSNEQVVANADLLAEAIAQKGGFVVLVRFSSVDGKDLLHPDVDKQMVPGPLPQGWDSVVPELADIKNAYIITKRQMSAFYGTDLDLQLRRRGIDTIVLCGISTSLGVDTTAREANQLGYNQIFAEDAMAAGSGEEHAFVCKFIFPRMGKIRSSGQIREMLE